MPGRSVFRHRKPIGPNELGSDDCAAFRFGARSSRSVLERALPSRRSCGQPTGGPVLESRFLRSRKRTSPNSPTAARRFPLACRTASRRTRTGARRRLEDR